MANIQVGGKLSKNGRFRIERPFVGVVSGLSVNRLRVLDLAAERDPHVSVRGDVQLVTGVLDRTDLQRMQQVRNFQRAKTFKTFFYFSVFVDCYACQKKNRKQNLKKKKANEMLSLLRTNHKKENIFIQNKKMSGVSFCLDIFLFIYISSIHSSSSIFHLNYLHYKIL